MPQTASRYLETVGGDKIFVEWELRENETEILTVEIFSKKT